MKPLFYDQLVASPHISGDIKKDLSESIVIEGSHVSDYYFQGTDQEMWDLRDDFPNIAPPFEKFFVEFRAPSQIISKASGLQEWDLDRRPVQWGALCLSNTVDSLGTDLDSPDGRYMAIKRAETILKSVEQSLDFSRLAEIKSLEQMTRYMDSLPKERRNGLLVYYAWNDTLNLMRENKWEEVKTRALKNLEGVKWNLGLMLFIKFNAPSLQSSIKPCWGIEIHVGHDGKAIKNANGDASAIHHAYGNVQASIEDALATSIDDGVELQMKLRDSFMPMIHTTLLAVSFMHCKNVVLTRQTPPKIKPTPKQKRWHTETQQLSTYHVLNIEPMKQVLKTEGQSEKTGLQRSLHICRGHFAHYDEEHKLFGKYAGTYWKPQHIRGTQKVGVVAKDYRIKL